MNDFKTTVRRDGDGWRLNGRKFYCTGSLAGDITFGPCRVEGTEDDVRVFFTPTDAEGVTIHEDWSGFGQRTTASGTTEFDDVWIPEELVLESPDSDGGGGGAVTSLNYQAVHTGVFVGIAKNALDDAVEFLRTKARLWYESTAERVTEDPYNQLHVGEMKIAVDAAELLTLRAADLCDAAVEAIGTPQEAQAAASPRSSPARHARRPPMRRCSRARPCSRCAAPAASTRSTGSIATGATPARCRCTTPTTSRPRVPPTSCSTTGFRPSTPTTDRESTQSCLTSD